MPAYIVVQQHEVTDPDRLAKYADAARPIVIAHGGKYLSLGQPTEPLEGTWTNGLGIVQFDSVEAAKAMFFSDEYAPLAKERQASGRMDISLIDGI